MHTSHVLSWPHCLAQLDGYYTRGFTSMQPAHALDDALLTTAVAETYVADKAAVDARADVETRVSGENSRLIVYMQEGTNA